MAYKFQLGDAVMSGSLAQGSAISASTSLSGDSLTLGSYGIATAGVLTIASMGGNWTNASRTIADLGSVTTCDINGGAIDGATIGANSAAAGTFTALVGTSLNCSDGNITNVGSIALDSISADDGSSFSMGTNWTNAGRTVADAGILTTVDINGGSIDGTIIGAAAVAAGSFAAVVGTTGTYSGVLKTDDTTEASAIGTAALVCDGGASVAKDLYVGDDLMLLSDAAVLNFGADKDVNLTHVADTGLLLNGAMQLQFRDSTEYIQSDTDGDMMVRAATTVNLNIGGTDRLAASANGINVTGGGVFSGVLKTDATTDATSVLDGSLQTDGGLSVAKDAVLGNDVKLLSDDAVLNFGADSDVSLTHVADAGLLLNAGMYMSFRDSALKIASSADGFLDISADTKVNMSGAVGMSSTLAVAGAATLNGAVTLGNATGDDLTFTGRIASTLDPKTDNAYDLGSSDRKFRAVYAHSIVGANTALDVASTAAGGTIAAATDFALITSGNGGTITLPAVSAGKVLHIKLSSSVGDAIIAAATGERVQSSGSIRLESTGSAITLVGYDGVDWKIM